MCPAKHLAREHLQAIDLAFNRSLTPRQRDPGLHGGVIRTPSFGEASEGWESARGRACQPWITLGRLTLADKGSEVLRERHRLRQFGRLRGQLRQLVVILIRGPCRRTQDQPGGPTRGEQASWDFCHRWQRLIALALPGRQSLRLTHAPDIQRHNAILALKALATDGPEEMGAIPAPAVPPGQEGRFVRIEEAAVAGIHRLALGKRGALQIALHGAPTEADLRRNGVQGPPLLMMRPDLVILGPPSGPPLAGQACCGGGRLRRGEQHRRWLGGCRQTGRIVHRHGRGALGIGLRQLGSMGGEHLGQCVREIL